MEKTGNCIFRFASIGSVIGTSLYHSSSQRSTGEAGQDKGPVDLCPAERVRHGWRTPGLQAQLGEPDKENSPVDCCPGERPSQEGSGRCPSEAGKAKRRGRAGQGLFQRLPSALLPRLVLRRPSRLVGPHAQTNRSA